MLSFKYYFNVPKGDSDIWIFYNLTACGLNATLWALYSWMPTVHNVLDCATHVLWFGYIDVGQYSLTDLLTETSGCLQGWMSPG